MNNNDYTPIPGYEGYYGISRTGDVLSFERDIPQRNGRTRHNKDKILKPKKNKEGYLFVTLCKGGKRNSKYIHRLSAEVFLPNPENLPEVNHKGLKTDNTPDMLEWVNHSQNVQHAYDNDLTTNKGGQHYFAVAVTDNELGRKFDTIKDWCTARGINYSTGRNILSGCNKSKIIDLSAIVKQTKSKAND